MQYLRLFNLSHIKIYGVALFAFLFFINTPPCFSDSADGSLLYLEPLPVFKDQLFFENLLKKEDKATAFELQKIEYILDRISKSSCSFIRNGDKQPGITAMLFLRWKYARYMHEVKTAEDFIKKIADGSRMSRKRYKVMMQNKKVYDLEKILLNELAHLEYNLDQFRSRRVKDVVEDDIISEDERQQFETVETISDN